MEREEIHLLKKGHSGLRQLLFGRITVVLILFLTQLFLLVALFLWFEEYWVHYFGSSAALALTMVLYLQNKQMNPPVRSSWTVLILLAPVFGTLLYVYTRLELGQRLLRSRLAAIREDTIDLLSQDPAVTENISRENSGAASMVRFASRSCESVLYQNTAVTYIPVGEKKLEMLLSELEKAEKFIYLEYFIISEGRMWGQILDVLARKASQGVDVRVLYDGTCEFILLPKGYPRKLEKLGIRCKVFSPLAVFVSTHYNFRDHRKILVIDGHTAFNGGINLSDEYINVNCKLGHWKDTAVMMKGDAVKSFTKMFLQMWNLDERNPDYQALDVSVSKNYAQGYVMPFCDDPMDKIRVGQRIYMDMIQRAVESVNIMTPYLIIDDEMEKCLCYAAGRGVRVRLLLPGIPDKYVPNALAKTHYRALLSAGVEIFEYTPGFVHSKIFAVDGREAVVGTINFDYRSFCHHFECGTWMHGCDCIREILLDFEDCFRKSKRITEDDLRHEKWHRKLTGYLLKGFEPLL